MTITPITVLCVAGAITLLGASLFFIGLRGRRGGDHPMCRRCGFDLFGKSEESHQCSECGADLRRARATVLGVRVARRGVAWAGAALLVPALLALAVFGYGSARGVDWQKQKPVWWLAREAEGTDVAIRDAALSELLGRYGAGALAKPQVGDLVARGLRVQGDVNRPWAVAWGDLIEQARLAGDVTDEQWKTYAGQAVLGSITLRFRPRLRAGDPVPYRLDYGPARVGRRSPLWSFSQLGSLTIDGAEVKPALIGGAHTGSLAPQRRGASTSMMEHRAGFLGELAPGRHRGMLTIRAGIADAANLPPVLRPGAAAPRLPFANPTTSPQQVAVRRQQVQQLQQQQQLWSQQYQEALRAFHDGTAPTLATVDLALPFEFELVGPDTLSVEPVVDPQLRGRVARAITVSKLRVIGSRLLAEVRIDRPPIDLSFDVFVRANGKEWPAGSIRILAGSLPRPVMLRSLPLVPAPTSAHFATVDFGAATTADFVFRPSSDSAARSPEIVRYWGEEVVVKNVAIDDPFSKSRDQRERDQRLLELQRKRSGEPVSR